MRDIRSILAEMKLDVKWTLIAEAAEYRESLILNERLKEDMDFRNQWLAEQSRYEPIDFFDEDLLEKRLNEIKEGEDLDILAAS